MQKILIAVVVCFLGACGPPMDGRAVDGGPSPYDMLCGGNWSRCCFAADGIHGTCLADDGHGQPLTCDENIWRCMPCGESDQYCCGNSTDPISRRTCKNTKDHCRPVDTYGWCNSCGAIGQACCKDFPKCDDGLSAGSGPRGCICVAMSNRQSVLK